MCLRSIRDVDWTARNAASGSMETAVCREGSLEHVPVRDDIEVRSVHVVHDVGKDMPGVRGRNIWEKVVRVS